MKRTLLFLIVIFGISPAYAQQVLYDFESPETTTNFQIFGSALEGQLTSVIANPDASGINTSANVMEYVKAGDAQTWGGAFANPAPADGIDASNGGQVCFDVWMDHIGLVSLKLETTDPNDPENYRQEVANTVANQWERLCFDLDWNSLDGNMTPARGKKYNNIVIFPDFGTAGNGSDITYYLDNFTVPESVPVLECTTLFDFDTLTTDFQYFGSALDGQLTSVVNNPNKSGINESDSVLYYIKAGDAQTWAGAFITPELTDPIDGSTVKEICVKVHWTNPGNLTLKLELPQFDDPENWIQTRDVETTGEWAEVCFDLSEPAFEGNMSLPVGKVFYKIILFPDFGIAGTGEDVDYYIDDIVLKSSNEVSNYDVTFSVDMNKYGGSFDRAYVSGSFNGWSGDGNPLDDSDGDGIWTATINMEQGPIEYKFTVDNWADQEMFNGTDVCTKTTDDGSGNIFVNRSAVIGDNVDLGTVCFNSCYACDESVKITWNLNMTEETVSEDGVYLAGGPFFGHGELEMTDSDGDGIYTITIERERGFETDYTFINGICLPDWSCKENLAGQPCAVPPFNDRHLDPVTEDMTISTCFGQCTDDGSCQADEKYNVTFNVDMRNEVMVNQVFIAGNTINNWNPSANEMTDDGGNGIYTTTVPLFPGLHEYKFINQDIFEELTQGEDCTITDPSGMFTNRLLILGEADTTLNIVVFGSCEISTNTNDPLIDNNLVTIYPSVTQDHIWIDFNEVSDEQAVSIYNVVGELMLNEQFQNVSRQKIELSGMTPGVHLVQVISGNKMAVKKIVIHNQ